MRHYVTSTVTWYARQKIFRMIRRHLLSRWISHPSRLHCLPSTDRKKLGHKRDIENTNWK
ncbi:hypothetical protein ATANTOWER_026985, partial [Ataeniobius toweri]|nr:hypothetical protein [Ataeniobius toweri]